MGIAELRDVLFAACRRRADAQLGIGAEHEGVCVDARETSDVHHVGCPMLAVRVYAHDAGGFWPQLAREADARLEGGAAAMVDLVVYDAAGILFELVKEFLVRGARSVVNHQDAVETACAQLVYQRFYKRAIGLERRDDDDMLHDWSPFLLDAVDGMVGETA